MYEHIKDHLVLLKTDVTVISATLLTNFSWVNCMYYNTVLHCFNL